MLELESNNCLNFNRTVNSVKGEKSRGGFCGGGGGFGKILKAGDAQATNGSKVQRIQEQSRSRGLGEGGGP